MAFRKQMSRKASKRNFRKTASRSNGKNFRGTPMRGGFRL